MTPEDRWLSFGYQLSQLRDAAGLSGVQLAERVGWQPSKVSKIQTGKQPPSDVDVTSWCDAVEATAEQKAELLAELRAVRLEAARFKSRLRRGGHTALQNEFALAEAAATRFRIFEPGLIPGHLQTADYARAIFSGLADLRESPRDFEEAVSRRMQRQAILYDSDRRFEIVVTEGALRTRIGSPQIMISQLNRLSAVLGVHNVRFGIVPQTAVLPLAPIHGFWMIDDGINVELFHTEASSRSVEDADLYSRIFVTFQEFAVEGDEAQAIINRCVADLGRSAG